MRYILFLLIAFNVAASNCFAQLNSYSVGFDLNPLANSEKTAINLVLLSTKDNLPIKLNVSYGNNIKPRGNYEYNFFYLKPGYLLKLSENEVRGKLFYLASNLDMARIGHHFKTTITDIMQTSRVIEYNEVSYTLGYELEIGIYKNIGKSLFSLHYGFTLGGVLLHDDPMRSYFNLSEPYNTHIPGIGNNSDLSLTIPLNFTAFIGLSTRL